MSSNSTGRVGDTTAVDYLNDVRLAQQKAQAANTAQNNYTLNAIAVANDTVDISDAANFNGNQQTVADIVDISDGATETDYPAGASSLAGSPTFKKLWLQFNNDVLDNSTNGNDGTTTYHSSLKALYAYGAQGSIKDATSGAHDLTLTAGTTKFAQGKEGVGLLFDGSTYYTANSAVIVSGTADRSVAFWFKTPSNIESVSNNYFFSWGTWSTQHKFFGLTTVASGISKVLYLQGWNDDLQCSTLLKPNTWYHVVCVVSSTGSVLTVYLNGASEATSSGHAINTDSSSLNIANGQGGGNVDILDSGFIINQFRIYSIALSLAQVQALYMVGVIGSCHTFDGGERVACGSASTWDFLSSTTAKFSIAFWYKAYDYTIGGTVVLDTANYNSATGISVIHNNGQFYFIISNSTAQTIVFPIWNSFTIDSAWHHYVLDCDLSLGSNNAHIYQDNVLVATATKTANTPSTPPTAALYVGARSAGGNSVIGQVDDVQVYNGYILSSAERAYLYAKKDGWQAEDDRDYQNLWLSFDNDYVDKSGWNNVGTLTGTETYVAGAISYADGRLSKAFSLDGSSYITYPVSPFNWERTQAFSVAFWYKSASQNNKNVIGNQQGGSFTGKGWGIWVTSDPDINFNITNTDSSNMLRVRVFSSNLMDGNWHHVVITYDGSSTPSGVQFYVDGTLLTNSTISNTLSATSISTSALTVGALAGGGGDVVASIDDLQIWNYVLTTNDITTLRGGQQIMHNPVVPTPAQVGFCELVA